MKYIKSYDNFINEAKNPEALSMVEVDQIITYVEKNFDFDFEFLKETLVEQKNERDYENVVDAIKSGYEAKLKMEAPENPDEFNEEVIKPMIEFFNQF